MTQITIPRCPNCGEGEHYIDHTELHTAGGFVNCDRCGTPVQPDAATLDRAAIDCVLDGIVGKQLAHKPSLFFSALAAGRDALLAEWKLP